MYRGTYKAWNLAGNDMWELQGNTAQNHVGSYANVVNGYASVAATRPSISSASALVLDDSCVVDCDLSKHAMGKVKDVNSIPNLRALLMDEGFSDVKLMYLGGMWVMFEFDKVDTKRIVWVDIEGIPLNVWSRETFMRIGKKWGETLDIEDNVDSSFGHPNVVKNGGSVLGVLEDMIRVGQAMGYTMDGCVKDLEHIIGTQGADDQASCKRVLWGVNVFRLWIEVAGMARDNYPGRHFIAIRSIDEKNRVFVLLTHLCQVFDHFISSVGLVDVKNGSAYDSVRWDYLLDILEAFGFGQTWCKWIRGTFSSARASILVNGSPSNEFSFHCGLKQGDPLSPYLFILIMESLHMSFSRAVDEGEWSDANLKVSVNLGVMVPKGVLKSMEAIRSNFFNGADSKVKKITWAAWDKILASKKNGGLDDLVAGLAPSIQQNGRIKLVIESGVSFRSHMTDGFATDMAVMERFRAKRS
ncbi:RNA-directed DNA polymerase, eukaryota [Tanacetum coccineum]